MIQSIKVASGRHSGPFGNHVLAVASIRFWAMIHQSNASAFLGFFLFELSLFAFFWLCLAQKFDAKQKTTQSVNQSRKKCHDARDVR